MRLTSVTMVFFAWTQACASTSSNAHRPPAAAPAACAEGLQELGLASAPSASDIRATYDSAHQTTLVVLPPREPIVVTGYGLHGFTGLMQFPNKPPVALPDLTLDFLVSGPEPRSYDERILTFQLPDSTRVRIGAGSAMQAPTGTPGAIEHVLVVVSPEQQRQLIRATKLRGFLGSTSFEISARQLDGLRAMALYARCGAQ